MEPIGPRITGVEHGVKELKEAVERMTTNHSGNQNVTNVRFEGGKSIVTSLLIGLVCGLCLGLGLGVVGWVSWALSRQDTMNMSIGAKFVVRGGMVLLVNGLVPIKKTGLQPNVAWTAGLEYTF